MSRTVRYERCPHFAMEPEAWYGRAGLVIPHVVLATAVRLPRRLRHVDRPRAVPLRDLARHVLEAGRGGICTTAAETRWTTCSSR